MARVFGFLRIAEASTTDTGHTEITAVVAELLERIDSPRDAPSSRACRRRRIRAAVF